MTLHYIQSGTKSGQGSEFGIIQCPGDLVIFPGQAVKIRFCPGKFGADGHLSRVATVMGPISRITSKYTDIRYGAKSGRRQFLH